MSAWRDIVTGIDGVSHDIGRWGAVLMCLTGIGLQIYAVGWKGQAFDMQAFGIGSGALATGIGAMLKLKADTEPQPKDKP